MVGGLQLVSSFGGSMVGGLVTYGLAFDSGEMYAR